jgi:hypothetical protein
LLGARDFESKPVQQFDLAMTTPQPSRPSDARRKRLSDQLTVPTVSSFFPIEVYYQKAQKAYEAFQQAFEDRLLDDAYHFGKRYCWFCLEAIPTHNYYNSAKFVGLKNTHHAQIDQVLTQMEKIVQWMDEEELEKELQEHLEAQRIAQLEEEQQQAQIDNFQRRLEEQQQSKLSSPSALPEQIQQSAIAKLALLQANGHRNSNHDNSRDHRIKRDPSGEEPMGLPSSRYRILDDETDDDEDDTSAALPPPVLPPSLSTNGHPVLPPPPAYHAVAHRRGLTLGPSKVHPIHSPQSPPKRRLPMSQLIQQYKQTYIDFHAAGRIRVTPIPSYQGRIHESTNGCTVISALVAAHHLKTSSPSNAIGTDSIVRIIDRECVPILKLIRNKLGLGAGALIIPSDVHDHLVDVKILQQQDFEGAAGGNIMDPVHFGSFTNLLAVGDDGKGHMHKAAATLFFREHVVSIVKLTGGGKPRFDLIDSLPGTTSNGQPMATRTHCQDLESLEVLLKWYCIRKFSESNCTYIDRNSQWDDAMADVDPRVFQGFVWMLKQ